MQIPLALLMMFAVPASSGQSANSTINVAIGEFKTVDVESDISRIAVAAPQIADYTVVSKRELLINGNRAGRTSLKIWTVGGLLAYMIDVGDGRHAKSDTSVGIDAINAKVQKIVHNPSVIVSRTDRGYIVSGQVETEAELKKVEKIVKAYAAGADQDVTNVLDIRKRPRQVKLKVRVMDISEKASKSYGIDWGSFQYSDFTGVGTSNAYRTEYIMNGTKQSSTFPRIVAPLRKSHPFTVADPFMVQIKYLIDSGVIRLLSAPDIVALSGAKTDIVIGGQIPVPSSTSSGGTTQTSIEWRDYGIKMTLEPNIVEQNRVTAKIYVEVSSLDNSNAITISGSLIPAMKLTQATSEINTESGKTVFLSGLKQEKNTRNVVGLPGLAELPVVGGLFGTHTKVLEASDLIISVTPEIIEEGEGGGKE